MNLLLLLSALLSALTGMGPSARAPEPSRAVTVVGVGRVAAKAVRARIASRPADALPALVAVAPIGLAIAPLVIAEPLWIDRRRE